MAIKHYQLCSTNEQLKPVAVQPGIAVDRFARKIVGILTGDSSALAATECQPVGRHPSATQQKRGIFVAFLACSLNLPGVSFILFDVAMMDAAHMEAARNHILLKYHVSPDARLSRGMEAEVYAYAPDTVLKLYVGTTSLTDLLILQDFYNSLDRQLVPYALPYIHTVTQEDHFLITIEQRLAGTRMSAVLPKLTADQLGAMMQRYLTAALAISHIPAPPAFERYKLFDPEHLSDRISGDWHQFLVRYLTHKLAQVTPHLSRDVPQFAEKVQRLRTILDQPYRDDYRLIHGDFFPGNLLINDEHQITALLDFGLLTMYGDYLFDIATGWVFFDMYDELKAQAREQYLAMLLDRLGKYVRGKLYRYVLIYSILSANTYSSNCADGHYYWCVANLSNTHYWNEIE